MSNWNTPEGIRIAEMMLACAGILVYFDDGAWYVEGRRVLDRDAKLNFNDAARQLGERCGMGVRQSSRGGYIITRRYGRESYCGPEGWAFCCDSLANHYDTYTAACIAMAELALKEEGR